MCCIPYNIYGIGEMGPSSWITIASIIVLLSSWFLDKLREEKKEKENKNEEIGFKNKSLIILSAFILSLAVLAMFLIIFKQGEIGAWVMTVVLFILFLTPPIILLPIERQIKRWNVIWQKEWMKKAKIDIHKDIEKSEMWFEK